MLVSQPHRHAGKTLIGWMFTIAILGFFVLLFLRLLPGYLEFYKVKGVLESLERQPGLTSYSIPEVRKLIRRRLEINSVEHVRARDFRIEKHEGRLTVRVRYEVRVPVLGNVDAVEKFEDRIEVVRH